MAMQTDVSTVHLNTTGFGYLGRTRVKGLIITSAAAGTVSIWDTVALPVAASYAQSGYVVTVTSTLHGLTTGQRVGISFVTNAGVSATNGNYQITVLTADTFTITDINTRTITATSCSFVSNTTGPTSSTQWHASFDIPALIGTTTILFPGEGVLIETALYFTMTATNITSITAFYG